MAEDTLGLDVLNENDIFASSVNCDYGRLNDSQHEQITIDLSDEDDDIGAQIPSSNRHQRFQDPRGLRVPSESSDERDINNNQVDDAQLGELAPGRTEDFQPGSPSCIKKMKLFVAGLAIMFLVLFLFVPPMPLTHVECIQDMVQDSFQGQFDYFKHNPKVRNSLMIVFGALTDFIFIVFMLQWVHYGGSWRFVLSLCLTYGLRLILCKIFYLKQPVGGDLWTFPGFYSLTVQYGTSNDYYFNPVMAICTQLFFEFRQLEQSFFKWLSLITLVGEFYLSLCLKGHYLIDNYGGIIIGYQIWSMTGNYLCYYIDVQLFGLTLHERFPRGKGIQLNCGKCKTPIYQWVQQQHARGEYVNEEISQASLNKKAQEVNIKQK